MVEESEDLERRALFPGKEVELDIGTVVTVYPMGFRHIKKFGQALTGALSVLANTEIRKGASKKDMQERVMANLTPFLLTNFIELISECCSFQNGISIEDLPHWNLPPIVEAWIDESFGEEKKYRPWIETTERVVSKFLKREFNLTEIFSGPSSSQESE